MNTSMNYLVILFLALTTISCNKDPEFEPGLFVDPELVLFETDAVSVHYQENEKEVKLIIEDLLNTSDDRNAEFPILDFLSISVDVNNNKLADDNVDKRYSISSVGTSCMQFILDEGNAGTGCIEEEGFSYKVDFRSSGKFAFDHIIYEYIINKEIFFKDSDTVGLVFALRGEDAGGQIPAVVFPTFIETIEFSL